LEEGERMHFIILARWRKKPTKEMLEEAHKLEEQAVKEGVKILGNYWTFGRWDIVFIAEISNEKVAMKALLRFGDLVSTETLIAVPAEKEEMLKLVE
jgi:uncharacterized protein with GYD domain